VKNISYIPCITTLKKFNHDPGHTLFHKSGDEIQTTR